MKFGRNTNFDKDFLLKNMMGPNCVRIAEELTQKIQLSSEMRILDLGCGTGLTSIFLAKEFGAQVFAADLWIKPTENYERFKKFGFENQIIPIHAEAHELPFAHHYFDAIISIDAYYYFGAEPDYLDKHIVPLIKKHGLIAVSVPGLQKDFSQGVPDALKPYWQENMNFYSRNWWKDLWELSPNIVIEQCFSHQCHKEAWKDWLECDNPYAKTDVKMMEAENGNYFDTIGLIAAVK
ncbi:methyltransferase domain-containing protein [Pelotomaculum terephthalicicum JT]|uniref:SAM-dependent methyltransferase n=1 Tax=Pelotomaculum terephthalicicum TaxID=206393 RepID=UPI0009D3913B|nr:methyltransferase domain-containing protein [Pelotomaculum terephthalicicum]MCG9968722.1 methyltransferase domain-containing protein [Pelotomaculum terephthalicicum JT]OPY60610.1 MAG: Glycine/sarcosine/dimethylglycine N-methyltransferase [Pelotomaculum sp. PtaU1.Bin065]